MARRQRARTSILTGLGLLAFALVSAACGGGALMSGGGLVGGLLVVGIGVLLSFTAATQSGCVGPCLSPAEPDVTPCLDVSEPDGGFGDGDGDGSSDGGTAMAPALDEARDRLVERGVLPPALAERLAHLDQKKS
jgi:hypothetical protein